MPAALENGALDAACPPSPVLEGVNVQDLDGRTAFVTGAASGIGLGIATALANAGCKARFAEIRRGFDAIRDRSSAR
jgi:hypothetical protein